MGTLTLDPAVKKGREGKKGKESLDWGIKALLLFHSKLWFTA